MKGETTISCGNLSKMQNFMINLDKWRQIFTADKFQALHIPAALVPTDLSRGINHIRTRLSLILDRSCNTTENFLGSFGTWLLRHSGGGWCVSVHRRRCVLRICTGVRTETAISGASSVCAVIGCRHLCGWLLSSGA